VLAVSSAHPAAHSDQRVDALLGHDFAIPVVHLWMAGDVGSSALDTLRAANAPVAEEPRAAIRAMSALAFQRPDSSVEALPRADAAPVSALTEFESKHVLEGWGLVVAPGDSASTVTEAIEAADAIGYPVVVKLSSPDVTHKTDVGGVAVNLRNPQSVNEAFLNVQSKAPAGARIDGVLVEKHTSGPEVIVGGLRDETFGAMILVGVGGVVAEALDDVRLASAPVSAEWVRILISSLAGLKTLTHPRHGEPADLDQLAQLVSDLSQRLLANEWLESFDVNPLVWSSNNWVAVDAALALAGEQE
jgi:acyl-CoA synthetase (NDP forming)